MIDKKKLLKEFLDDFEEEKKRIGFGPSFEELNFHFNISGKLYDAGYVPEEVALKVCGVIAAAYRDWHGYFNGLLIPSSGYYASQNEAKLFSSEEDKKLIWGLIKKAMHFSSLNSLVSLTKEDEKIKEFIDESFLYWENEFYPKLLEIMAKVNNAWRE